MKRRQARKLLKIPSHAMFIPEPRARHRRALKRYMRWKHRPLAHHNCAPICGYYVLDDNGRPVPFTGDIIDWAVWHSVDHVVARTEGKDLEVATIFLGLDHNFKAMVTGEDEPPLLFESAVHERGGYWVPQERYPTKHDALIGHTVLAAARGLI